MSIELEDLVNTAGYFMTPNTRPYEWNSGSENGEARLQRVGEGSQRLLRRDVNERRALAVGGKGSKA